MQGLSIPEDVDDVEAIKTWSGTGAYRTCTETAGYGLRHKGNGTPADPAKYLQGPDPGDPNANPPIDPYFGDTQAIADVDVYLRRLTPPKAQPIDNLWLGSSPSKFLYGDEGSPLFGPPAPKNRPGFLVVGLLVQGDPIYCLKKQSIIKQPPGTPTDPSNRRAYCRFVQFDPQRPAYLSFIRNARVRAAQWNPDAPR